MKYTKIN